MVDLGVFLILLILGYSFGRFAESRHFKSIRLREKETLYLPLITMKSVPEGSYRDSFLVSGNVVISVDYFKRILAALRNIFGGRVTSYETLVDRARREAILRMKQEAIDKNADSIVNVRLQTASISNSSRRHSIGSVEVVAYGTAVSKG